MLYFVDFSQWIYLIDLNYSYVYGQFTDKMIKQFARNYEVDSKS